MIARPLYVPKNLTPDRLVEIFQSKGYDPQCQKNIHAVRDGVHEAMHVVQSGSKTFDRDKLHEALERTADRHPLSRGAPRRRMGNIGALIRFELQARAAEMLVCQHFKIEYDLEGWALTMWAETSKAYRVDVGSVDAICDSIRIVSNQLETRMLLDRVLGMRMRRARAA